MNAHAIARDVLEMDQPTSYMPHVSLLYAELEEKPKDDFIQQLKVTPVFIIFIVMTDGLTMIMIRRKGSSPRTKYRLKRRPYTCGVRMGQKRAGRKWRVSHSPYNSFLASSSSSPARPGADAHVCEHSRGLRTSLRGRRYCSSSIASEDELPKLDDARRSAGSTASRITSSTRGGSSVCA